MSANCDMVFFQIYGQFAAIEKPDSGRMVYKTYFSLIVTFHLTELENRTKKSLTQLVYFLKLHMCVYFRTKFQIYLTNPSKAHLY